MNYFSVRELRNEEDKKLCEVAKCAGAVLITGNKRQFPDEPGILTPKEFMCEYQ